MFSHRQQYGNTVRPGWGERISVKCLKCQKKIRNGMHPGSLPGENCLSDEESGIPALFFPHSCSVLCQNVLYCLSME